MERHSVLAKKKRGPPPTGKGQQVVVRMHPPLMSPLDAWIATQPEPKPSRPEAIRRLLEKSLGEFVSPDDRFAALQERAARKIPKAKSPAKGIAILRRGHAENELRKLKAKKDGDE